LGLKLEHLKGRNQMTLAGSPGVRIGDYIFVSTQLGWNRDGNVGPDADFGTQFRRCFENVAHVLSQVNAELTDVVKARYYITDARDYVQCRQIRYEVWPQHGPPASAVVGVGLPSRLAVVGLETVAYLGKDRSVVEWERDKEGTPPAGDGMEGIEVQRWYPPGHQGRYTGFSPGMRAGALTFFQGHAALGQHDEFLARGDPSGQTHIVQQANLRVLEHADLSPEAAFKFFNFLSYPHYCDKFRAITDQYFPHRPLSSTIVAGLAWPYIIVESEVTAATKAKPEYIYAEESDAPSGRRLAARVGHFLFTSSIVATTASGQLVGKGDFWKQVHQVFANLDDILSLGSADYSDLVMVNAYVTSTAFLAAWYQAADAYHTRRRGNSAPGPASSVIAVPALCSDEYLVQVDAVAWVH
jgi:enamine deaminase RidA (YjgF/YER057c/UK114 family)